MVRGGRDKPFTIAMNTTIELCREIKQVGLELVRGRSEVARIHYKMARIHFSDLIGCEALLP